MTSRNEDGFLQWSRQNKELFRVFVDEAQDLGVEISQDAVAKLSIRLWNSLPESERDRFRNKTPFRESPTSQEPTPIVFASSKDGKFAAKTGADNFTNCSIGTRRDLSLSQDEVSRYQNFTKTFWKSVQKRSHQGSLDLSNLEQGSPLEACFILGVMRGKNWPMDDIRKGKPPNGDLMIEVPLLGTSLAVQSMIECERVYYQTQINNLKRQLDPIHNTTPNNTIKRKT